MRGRTKQLQVVATGHVKSRPWHGHEVRIFCPLSWIYRFKEAQCKDMLRERRDSRKDNGPLFPRTCPSVPPRCKKRLRIDSTKQSARAGTQLHRPALIKDSLQTGASHWADFWNGFLIPRDTSRAEGGFMQNRSVGHWQRIRLDKLLGSWKVEVGLGPVKATLLNYWQALTVVQGESEP